MFKMDGDSDQYADEAKYFTESRLLQRDVEIIMEGVSNANILGTIKHPVSYILMYLWILFLIWWHPDHYEKDKLHRSIKLF